MRQRETEDSLIAIPKDLSNISTHGRNVYFHFRNDRHILLRKSQLARFPK